MEQTLYAVYFSGPEYVTHKSIRLHILLIHGDIVFFIISLKHIFEIYIWISIILLTNSIKLLLSDLYTTILVYYLLTMLTMLLTTVL